jgi:hypothetical protein
VYEAGGAFKERELRHDDLAVSIAPDAPAAFYEVEDAAVLDHSAQVLGLRPDAESSPAA